MPEKTIDLAYKKAIEVLAHCTKKEGFYASGLPGGYEAVWSRDSMITSLGACLVQDEKFSKKFKTTFRRSLELLGKNQSKLGQIPNCVGSYNVDRHSKVTYNTLDSTMWFIIGHHVYAQAYEDDSLKKKHEKKIEKALTWLKYQDPNEDKLLAQQPTMDWEDAFPHKYGRTINTHALYYIVLNFLGEDELKQYIRRVINRESHEYLSLYRSSLGYYLPWAWKSHNGDLEHEEWFDSLGNLLAVIGGLASREIASKIINYVDNERINKPFACKAIWPPISPDSKAWHSYFSKCDARVPLHYLNAGIWPYIGGFYVASLVKRKKFKLAEKELEKLAKGNMQARRIRMIKGKYEFNEWLDGASGEPKGEPYQGWSAGTYIYAYECVKQRKVLFF